MSGFTQDQRDRLTEAGLDPDDPIVISSDRWIRAHNASCKQGNEIVGTFAVEFMVRNVRANLDPHAEKITAYCHTFKGVTNLVWHPAVETYLHRAEATGQYLGLEQGTKVREGDRKVMAYCTVSRIRKVNGVEIIIPTTVETNIDQAHAVVGKGTEKSWWGKARDHMAGLFAFRQAMRGAFPDHFNHFDADDSPLESDASDPGGESPSRQADVPARVATSPTPATTANPAPAAARDALRGTTDTAPATTANPAPAAARDALRGTTDTAPAATTTRAPAADPYGQLVGVAEDHGYSENDLDSICMRLRGCAAGDLLPDDRDWLASRVLPNKPATAEQWDNIQDIAAALPERFPQIVEGVMSNGMALKYVTTGEADQIIEAGRAALR